MPRAAVIYAFYGTCCDSSNARRRRCSRRARPAEQGQSAAVGHSVQILGSNSTRRSLAAALHPLNKAVIISQALSPDWCYGWRRSVGLDAYTALLLQRCDVIQTAHATPYKSAPGARGPAYGVLQKMLQQTVCMHRSRPSEIQVQPRPRRQGLGAQTKKLKRSKRRRKSLHGATAGTLSRRELL